MPRTKKSILTEILTEKQQRYNWRERGTPIECKYCEHKCSVEANLNLHEEIHRLNDDIPKFVATKTIATKSKKICNQQLFDCTVCGKLFLYKSNLSNHIKWHKLEKRRHRRVCGTRSVDEIKLEPHTEHDDNETCDLCLITFDNMAFFEKHMRIHKWLVSLEEYSCRYCKRFFFCYTQKRQHECLHHLDLRVILQPIENDNQLNALVEASVQRMHKMSITPTESEINSMSQPSTNTQSIGLNVANQLKLMEANQMCLSHHHERNGHENEMFEIDSLGNNNKDNQDTIQITNTKCYEEGKE